MSLVIVGSLALDTIETPKGRRERIVGGSCTYCALAASSFTSPGIVGVVGEDFPDEVIELLKKRKIDIQGLERRPGKTFYWEGRYGHDPNYRTTLKLEMNVFDNFKPQLPTKYKETDILFLANIDPDLQEDILSQVKKPKIVAMDTINFWIKNKRPQLVRVMEKVNIFFANDEEVKLLTEEINLIKAGKRVLNMGPSLVVIKKGEHGALVLGKNNVFGVLAYPCEDVVDPTGAGDSFAGGFLGYMDRARQGNESDIRKAAVFGSVMASYTIEDFGIERLKFLSDFEIKERFSAFKKLISF